MPRFDPPLSACDLCGSPRISPFIVDHRDIRIFRCRDCGVRFMNPQYSPEFLGELYANYTTDNPAWDEPYRITHHYYLSRLEKHLPRKGRLLDIGCGRGHLISVAKERGWSATGVEIDPAVAEKTASTTGAEVLAGDFASMKLPENGWDVVTLHHVLEHLKSPRRYLERISAVLKPGGMLFLVLPNLHSRSAMGKMLLEKLGLRTRKTGAYYDTGHHLFYFTPEVLQGLLTRHGFRPLKMRSGYAVKPGHPALLRFWMRNVSDRFLWKSTFLALAQKTG
jgi:2-polyprenyl-3-methyl-5-hydroxy-6-metoxy-1,4-benzoquinol methylase